MVKELEVDLPAVFDHLYSNYIYRKFHSHKFLFLDFSFLIYLKIKLLIIDLTGLTSVPM